MKDLSRRKFLRGAAVAVPAAAAVAALPQIVEAAPNSFLELNDTPMEYAKGVTVDAWPGATIEPVYSELPERGEPMYYINFKTDTITLVGPCHGNDLYLDLKKRWRNTDAIRYAFPIMMITPNLFEMMDGWKLKGVQHVQDASLIDDGYGNRVLGCVSLGQVFKDEQLMWAPGDKNVRGFWQQFSNKGHVNEGVIFPSTSKTLWIRAGTERKDMGEMCGYSDMSCYARQPIRFPVWQQLTI